MLQWFINLKKKQTASSFNHTPNNFLSLKYTFSLSPTRQNQALLSRKSKIPISLRWILRRRSIWFLTFNSILYIYTYIHIHTVKLIRLCKLCILLQCICFTWSVDTSSSSAAPSHRKECYLILFLIEFQFNGETRI